MPMTSRERLTRAYYHQEMDRPCIYIRGGLLQVDPSYARLAAYVYEYTDLKGAWSAEHLQALWPEETITEPYSAEFERAVTTLHAPAGDLRASTLNSLSGQPGLHETYFINSPEDAEVFLSLPQPKVSGEVETFYERHRAMGERGIVEVGLGMNPAGFAAELCGSENFAILSITDREIMHALCEWRMQMLIERTKHLLAHNVGPFFSLIGEEYLVPPLHGMKDFTEFNVAYDKPIIDLIHDAGGRVHIHSHGRIRSVMQGFLDAGTDVLHPFEAPPMGDITAAEAKAMARGKLTLEGNVQIHHLYERTPEAIRAETKALVADVFDDQTGLIVCPTASPYIVGEGETCFPQYQAMIDTVLVYGK